MLAHDGERALERYQKTFGIASGVTVTTQALDEGRLVGYQLFARKNVTPGHLQRRFPILLHAEWYAKRNGLRNRRNVRHNPPEAQGMRHAGAWDTDNAAA